MCSTVCIGPREVVASFAEWVTCKGEAGDALASKCLQLWLDYDKCTTNINSSIAATDMHQSRSFTWEIKQPTNELFEWSVPPLRDNSTHLMVLVAAGSLGEQQLAPQKYRISQLRTYVRLFTSRLSDDLVIYQVLVFHDLCTLFQEQKQPMLLVFDCVYLPNPFRVPATLFTYRNCSSQLQYLPYDNQYSTIYFEVKLESFTSRFGLSANAQSLRNATRSEEFGVQLVASSAALPIYNSDLLVGFDNNQIVSGIFWASQCSADSEELGLKVSVLDNY